MSSLCHYSSLKKSHLRQQQRRRRRRKLPDDYIIKSRTAMKLPRFLAHLREFLFTFKSTTESSSTLNPWEELYQGPLMELISLVKKMPITCPMICLFCEHFITDPVTLFCGHTYCETCLISSDFNSVKVCPRCPKDLQGQIPSSIDSFREKSFSKNHFLKEILERSQTVKNLAQNSSLYRQAETEYAKENYQKALEIYSAILQNFDDHYVFFGRAKTYVRLKDFDKALTDIERVIELKPHWTKGHFVRSEILFQMKRFTAALFSSLQGLALNPDDSFGKELIERHLNAVSQGKNEDEIDSELRRFSISTINHDDTIADSSGHQLMKCKSSKSAFCLCGLFDDKNLRLRDFDCSICANLFWFPITTPCGHVFCRECLIRSIDNTQNLCPMCKNPLEKFFTMLIQNYVNQTEIISQLIETFYPKEYEERKTLYEQENVQGTPVPKVFTPEMESTVFEIPIFVCVLALPHSVCPLHVFEPRYRLMMRRAIETESRTFGMCKYDEQTETFSEFGTLLFIRGFIYTPDGRSILDTMGQRRFRVLERDQRDGYDTARVRLIRDHSIDTEAEFNEVFQMNQVTYGRVRQWFDQLDSYRKTLISRRLETYPPCDDLTRESADGPAWAWIMLNILPIEPDTQYAVLISQSFRVRLKIINDTMDFLFQYHQQLQQEEQQAHDEEVAATAAEATSVTNQD